MPSESLLLAVALGPLALGAALTAALLLWGVWPDLSAAWERAGLPRLALVWPEPEAEEDAPTLALPVAWPVLLDLDGLERVDATPDHLKEAA